MDSSDSESDLSDTSFVHPEDLFMHEKQDAHHALQVGNLKSIRELIRSKDIFSKEKYFEGYLPLCVAISARQIQTAKLLLKAGARVNYSNISKKVRRFNSEEPISRTPLHHALLIRKNASFSDIPDTLDFIKQLIEEYKAEVNATAYDGKTALHFAVENSDFEAVKVLIDHGALLDIACNKGQTPLYLAIDNKNIEMSKLLREAGASINFVSRHGTFLHLTVTSNCTISTEYLLEEGVDPNVPNELGQTPLHLTDSLTTAELLLKHNADINKQDRNGDTPLHYAIRCHHQKQKTLFLIRMKAMLNIKNNDDETPLSLAFLLRNEDVIHLLLQHGADINEMYEQKPIFIQALKYCNPNIILYLMKMKLAINKTKLRTLILTEITNRGDNSVASAVLRDFRYCHNDARNGRLLLNATFRGLTCVVEPLLKEGADVNMKRNTPFFNTQEKHSLLQIAVKNVDIKMVELLIKYGADVNVLDSTGRTLLYLIPLERSGMDPIWTSRNKESVLMKMLLNKGLNPVAELKDGSSIIHYAAYIGCNFLLERILKSGKANINHTTNAGMTALHIAIREGWLSIINMLLKSGACISSKMKGGLTPLHIAVIKERPEAFCHLIDAGADFEETDDFGRTPLHIAMWNGSMYFVQELLWRHANIYAEDCEGRRPVDMAFNYTDCYTNVDKQQYQFLNSFKMDYRFDVRIHRDFLTSLKYKHRACAEHVHLLVCKRYCYFQHREPVEISDVFRGFMKFTNYRKKLLTLSDKQLMDEMNAIPKNLFNSFIINQVLEMRKKKASVCTTYHDIIARPINEIALKMKEQKLLRKVRFSTATNEFQHYSWMIKSRLKEAEEHFTLIKAGINSLRVIVNYDLPDLVLGNIVIYLDHTTIKKMLNIVNEL